MGAGLGRFAAWEAGKLVLGLCGAVLLAAAVSALSAGHGGYAGAVFARLLALVSFDLGASAMGGVPVSSELAERLPATLELMGVGFLLALLIGVPVGLALSVARILRAAAPLIQIVAATPVFCASLGLVWLAYHGLGWSDLSAGDKTLFDALAAGDNKAAAQAFRAFALPALTVGIAGAACVQLALRRAASQAVDEPYRRGLRLMGLSAFEIERSYVAPQMLAALFASTGEIVLAMFSAAAVAEWVFAWPGAAVLFVKSVALRDWNAAAAVLLAFGALTLLAQFLGTLIARILVESEARA